MNIKEKVIVIASVIMCILQLQAQGADKFTDGNRPYEFGFSIEGEQHRHEKKDEKGLIEGEFGFITADGVYHVTVYATDEQGRFKIISMKNIRVKPYPTYTASSITARQGHSLGLPAAASTQLSLLPPVTTTTFKPISIEPPAKSCSHCSIPTTSTLAPVIPPFNQPSRSTNQIEDSGNPKFPQRGQLKPTFVYQTISTTQTPQRSFGISAPQSVVPNYPTQPQTNLAAEQVPSEQNFVPPQNSQNFPQQGFGPAQSPSIGLNSPQENLQNPGISNLLQSSRSLAFPQQELQTPLTSPIGRQSSFPNSVISENSPRDGLAHGNAPSDRTPKNLGGGPSINLAGAQPNYLQTGEPNGHVASALPTKPTLISAQMKVVDKNTDIYHRSPGENEGLPEGLTKDDMSKLLYTFNYTVGFHGHFEEGYLSGAKQGYYFVTGRNGVRTRVDYIADSKGFRPKISQEVLDLLSDDVPKAETEKEEKYGLKGYEFKWLYYPIEAKGR